MPAGETFASLVEHLVDGAVSGAAIDGDALQHPARPADQRDPEDLALEYPGLRREHDHLRHRFPGGGVLPHRDVRALARDVLAALDESSRARRRISASQRFVPAQARAKWYSAAERQPAEQHDRRIRTRSESEKKRSSCRPATGSTASTRDLAPRGDVLRHPAVARFSPADGTGWRCAGTGVAARRGARAGSRARARRPPSRARARRMRRRGPRSAARRASASVVAARGDEPLDVLAQRLDFGRELALLGIGEQARIDARARLLAGLLAGCSRCACWRR